LGSEKPQQGLGAADVSGKEHRHILLKL